MSTGYGWESIRQVCATLLSARHVPERLGGGSVYLGRSNKCSTFTFIFIGLGRYQAGPCWWWWWCWCFRWQYNVQYSPVLFLVLTPPHSCLMSSVQPTHFTPSWTRSAGCRTCWNYVQTAVRHCASWRSAFPRPGKLSRCGPSWISGCHIGSIDEVPPALTHGYHVIILTNLHLEFCLNMCILSKITSFRLPNLVKIS